MTEMLKASLAAPLVCPDWCTDHRTRDDDSISHARRYPSDGWGRTVVITQTDRPVDREGVSWIRDKATITVVSASAPAFDISGLTPEQGYALAALVGDLGDERLASAILDAAILLNPEVER